MKRIFFCGKFMGMDASAFDRKFSEVVIKHNRWVIIQPPADYA